MALLYKACYDHCMKIKRGRQILYNTQNTQTVLYDAEMSGRWSNMLNTKLVEKTRVQHCMLGISHPSFQK